MPSRANSVKVVLSDLAMDKIYEMKREYPHLSVSQIIETKVAGPTAEELSLIIVATMIDEQLKQNPNMTLKEYSDLNDYDKVVEEFNQMKAEHGDGDSFSPFN